jgi:hypothetical protein
VQLLKSATLIAAGLFVLALGQPAKAASLNLAWDPPISGTPAGYVLGYGTQTGVYTNIVNVGPSTSYTVHGLAEGRTYFFVVVAYTTAGVISAPTPELRSSLCLSAPSAPTGMTASVSGTLVNVAWAASSGGVNGYMLQASATSGGPAVATVPVSGTNFSAHAPPGTYFLRTAAINDCGSSGLSAEVAATVAGSLETLPGAPRSLTRTVSGRAVSLSWAPALTGGAPRRYIVELMSGANVIGAIDTGTSATSISHPSVPPGTYVLRVRGANTAGIGPPSSTVTVTVR